jgi:uncharacterized protein
MSGENTCNRTGLFLLGISLAIGIIISSVIIALTLQSIKMSDKSITVKGYAEKNIKSDLGIWTGSLSARSGNLTEAYNKLERDLDKFVSYLRSKGIQSDRITVSSINTVKNFRLTPDGMSTGIVDGFELIQNVTVNSADVNLINQISGEATSLIKDGMEIISNPPQFYYTKINDLKIEMLGEAAKDAKQRAEQLAKRSGSEVGSLKSANQGVFQITPPFSTEISDYGEYDLSTIQKTIKSVATIEFTIK